jgi:surfeit locus 1 family protein
MLVLTLATIASFALLIWLGFWQWDRYLGKRARQDAPPPPTASLESFERIDAPPSFVFGSWNGRPGWRVFLPVSTYGALVFVDAGFIPDAGAPDLDSVTVTLPDSPPLSGLLLSPSRVGRFAAPSAPDKRLFYAEDLAGMAASAGLKTPATYFIGMDYRTEDGGVAPYPFAPGADPTPPERHLGYAITWWGLAAGLIAVYLALHARLGRFSWR